MPQGSVLGVLHFLIYINDIADNVQSDCLLHADDTSLFDVVDDPTVSAAKLNSDLERICDWAKRWLVTINASKTKCMTFSVKCFKPFHPFVVIDNEVIDKVTQHTHLGVTLATNLSWKPHIFDVYERACKRVNMLKGLKFKLSRNILERLYKSLVCPVMEYADVVSDGCTESECDLLEHVQYEAAKIVTWAIKGTSEHRLMLKLGWEEMRLRRAVHKVILYYKIVNNLCPNYLRNLLSVQVSARTSYSLRNLKKFYSFC